MDFAQPIVPPYSETNKDQPGNFDENDNLNPEECEEENNFDKTLKPFEDTYAAVQDDRIEIDLNSQKQEEEIAQ